MNSGTFMGLAGRRRGKALSRAAALLAALALLAAASLAGCGGGGGAGEGATAAATTQAAGGDAGAAGGGAGTTQAAGAEAATSQPSAAGAAMTDAGGQVVYKELLEYEVSEWNPLVPSSAAEHAIYIDTLVEYDNYGLVQPCLAESWDRSADGLTWVFHLRKGVPWLNYDGTPYGEDTKAEDWVTTAKYILDPVHAARTADLLFMFEGAEDYYNALSRGEEGDWGAVGIRALDDYTLEYKLLRPLAYFLSTLTYNWGFPTCAKYLEEMGDGFGVDPFSILYNGEYTITDYQPESYRVSTLNPVYWDAENMHIDRVEYTFNAEAASLAPEMLARGEVNYATIPTNQVDAWMNDPQREAIIRPNRPTDGRSYWLLFNFWPNFPEEYDHENWLLAANDINFRKSIYYAFDRLAALTTADPYNAEALLMRSVTLPDFVAAGGKDYLEYGALAKIVSEDQHQPDLAQEYKQKAIESLTAKGATFPVKIYMPYNTGVANNPERAQVVKQQLERDLGTDYIAITLDGYPDTDYLNQTRRAGNYCLMESYWAPDYADPETFTDPFAIGQKYNYIYMADGMGEQTTESDPEGRLGFDGGFWKNAVYDAMVNAAAQEALDVEKRYEAFADAEAWLIDQAFIVPVGRLYSGGYVASYLDPFEKQFALFGCSGDRFKYQKVRESPMDTDEYNQRMEEWQEERARRIAEADAAGRDY